jgi:hypothetical protein
MGCARLQQVPHAVILKRIKDISSLFTASDQLIGAKQPEMVGNGRVGHFEFICQRLNRAFRIPEKKQDAHASSIPKDGKQLRQVICDYCRVRGRHHASCND